MQRYFGISPQQAANSVYPVYNASGGLKAAKYGGNLTWFFTEHWFLQGVAGFESGTWQGVMAPAATTDKTANLLATLMGQIVNQPDVKSQLNEQGAEIVVRDPAQLARFFNSERARWAKVVQSAARAAGRSPARIVCRGVVRPGQPSISKTTGQRRLLSGSYEKIREDVRWLESCGVTEVFYDLNFDPAVGDPAADEGKAMLRASEILEALAPDIRM